MFDSLFLTVILSQVYSELAGEEAMEVLTLLGEHPSGWTRDRLMEALRALRESDSDEKFSEWVDEAIGDKEESLVDDVSTWIWEHVRGVSAMSGSEIDEAITDEISDRASVVFYSIAKHVGEEGLPDGFAVLQDFESLTDLLYGRVGWRGDPDAPKSEEEVLRILHSLDPDRYPDPDRSPFDPEVENEDVDEVKIYVSDETERSGWWFAKIERR